MVEAARLLRGVLPGLAALICCMAVLTVACSPDAEEVTEQESAAQSTPTQVERPASAAAVMAEQQETQLDAPARTSVDPVELLIAEASALEHNGYWEQALAVQESAISSGDSLGVEALTSLKLDRVRLLLRLNLPAEAQTALADLSGLLTADQSRRHTLLSAQAALMLSQTDAAVEAMRDYVNSDSPAWAVIALELAKTLQRADRGSEAIEWAERALGGTLPSQDQLRAIHLAATELDIAGETERALAYYDELLSLSPWRDDQAAALSRTAVLQRDAGNIEAAQASWWTLVNDYREFAESAEALAFLLDSGVDVDQLTIGLFRFQEERWVEARSAMLNVLGGSANAAERATGEFYVAAIHQTNGDLSSAALGYVAVIGHDPTHPLAAESAMRLAEFAVADGDQITAEEYWRQVMVEHPEHRRAPEAARRWASLEVARGQWSEAAQRFRDTANDGADHWGSDVRQEFLLWAALMNQAAGDDQAAADLATEVIEIDPVSYYGLRAAEILELAPPTLLDIPIADWLTRLTGGSRPSHDALERSLEWRSARDLRLGGFDAAADRMLAAWADTFSTDPWALVDAAQLLAAHGEYSASARVASRVIALFGLNWTEAPAELLDLIYPQPWPDVMALHTAAEGVEPSLLWSLIRRESFYAADAEGLAGEVGLTQVIPLTGSDIAAALGIEYEHADLARPELAIRFGVWYLARQLEGFSNEPVMALAAYNAGPGNAARWEAEAVVAGVDGFLSALDFPSTRIYVQYVIESWAAYQALERYGQGQ